MLPGESLAKYTRSSIQPLDEAEEEEIRDLQENDCRSELEAPVEILPKSLKRSKRSRTTRRLPKTLSSAARRARAGIVGSGRQEVEIETGPPKKLKSREFPKLKTSREPIEAEPAEPRPAASRQPN